MQLVFLKLPFMKAVFGNEQCFAKAMLERFLFPARCFSSDFRYTIAEWYVSGKITKSIKIKLFLERKCV